MQRIRKASAMQVQIAYGKGHLNVELPDGRTTVIEPTHRDGIFPIAASRTGPMAARTGRGASRWQRPMGSFSHSMRAQGNRMRISGPAEAQARGSHVSLHCPEGFAVMRALIASGVVGDFRAPDVIRFGFAPLYNRFVDAWDAANALASILDERRWDDPRFRAHEAVTHSCA